MTKTEQLNKLFSEWKESKILGSSYAVFCKDGLVNPIWI